MQRLTTVVLLLSLLGTARADDGPSGAPPAAPATVKGAASAVLAAVAASDTKALQALAVVNQPDPWRVADELCNRGAPEAATRFARAAPRADVEALPAFVAGWGARDREDERRSSLAGLVAAVEARDAGPVLEATAALPPELDTVTRVRLTFLRGAALHWRRQWRASREVSLRAGEAARELGWLAQACAAYRMATRSAFMETTWPEMLSCGEQWLAMARLRGDQPDAALALSITGLAHRRLGHYRLALSTLEEALAQFVELKDSGAAVRTRGNIAIVYQNLGDLDRALAMYEEARVAKKAQGDEVGAATTLANIGLIYDLKGDYAKSLSIYEQAHREQVALGDRGGAAATLTNIGSNYSALGDHDRALEVYGEALAVRIELGDKTGIAGIRGNIATVYGDRGEYAKALTIYEAVLVDRRALGDALGTSVTLSNIAWVHGELGEHERALEIHQQAHVEYTRRGDRHGAARVLSSWAVTNEELKRYPEALRLYEAARIELTAVGDTRGVRDVRENVAIVQSALGDHATARATYERILAEREAEGDWLAAAVTLGNLAGLHQGQGRLEEADAARLRVLELNNDVDVALPTLLSVLGGLSGTRMITGDFEGAVKYARRAIDVTSRLTHGLDQERGARARDARALIFEHAVRAAIAAESPTDLVHFLERGRAGSLLESLGGRDRLRGTAVPEPLRLEEAQIRSKEREAVSHYETARRADSADRDQRRRELESARNAVVEVTSRIRRTVKASANLLYPEPASLKRIQATLREGDVLVLYDTQQWSVAVVVSQKTVRTIRLGLPEPITAASKALLRGVQRRGGRGVSLMGSGGSAGGSVQEHIDRLRALVYEPLELRATTKRLLISPHGALSYVPFELLVGEGIVLAYVPSGTTYELLREECDKRGEHVLALGDPQYPGQADAPQSRSPWRGETLQALPNSGDEARAVGSVVLTGKDATISAFTQALSTKERWRSVHLACHGIVDQERPTLSALAVTPESENAGFLRCLDVYRMQIPSDLVVMSACETGKGKIYTTEGIVGLTQAFMFAGAPRVLCSLWKVDDAATRALMIKFYELWHPKDGSRGLRAATALKRAQAFVRGHKSWAHPYYWAAWVLWGLPD